MRIRIGLYGIIINSFLILFNLLIYFFNDNYFSLNFFIIACPLFLLSSFLVYICLIPPYLRSRKNEERLEKLIVLDVLIGIVGEFLILIVSCTIFGLFVNLQGLIVGLKGNFSGLMYCVLILPLWLLAPVSYLSLSYQLIFFGTVSGVIGWLILKKKKQS
jgi:hypothetical protein